MIGFIAWQTAADGKRRKAVELREESLLHMRFLKAELLRKEKTAESLLRRRVLAAGKRLHKAGITHAVLPADFAYTAALSACGIRPVSTLPLRRMLAADWLQWSLERRGIAAAGGTVAVSARQLTGEVVRTVTEVALRHRYVLLDLPYGGEEVCRQLRREYGVSLLLAPTKEQLAEASGLILFDEQAALTEQKDAVLPLYDERVPLPPLSLAPAIEEKLPAGADRVQMVAALYQAGVLRAGQITFAHK